MRRIIFYSLVAAVMLISSCASISTSYDYDRSEDFTKFKTYKWINIEGTTNQLSENPFLEKTIYKSIQANLKSKGYVYEESGDTDFGVALQTKTQEQTSIDAVGGGFYGPWRAGVGTANIDVDQYTEGTLVIDIVDMTTKQLAWRGLGTKVVSSYQDNEKGQQVIQGYIDQIMANFPPPPASK